jgi:1A family penicillin-binding protein
MAKKKKLKKSKGQQRKYALPAFIRNISATKKRISLGIFVLFIVFNVWVFWGIPLPSQISNQDVVSTKLFDRKGKLIYEIYADKRRTPVKLSDIPDNVKHATISIEDKDFYKHPGFSVIGIGRGFYKTIFEGKLEGGSTLTQQLVKVTLLSPERTVRRKIREFALSIIIETIYSKDQILEMYLNQVPYGSTAYGVEAASEMYFDKPVKDLNLAESALLAGLTQAPSRYSPFGSNPNAALDRQKIVLRRMAEDKYITQQEADEASKQKIVFAKEQDIKAPHFALWVKEQLAEKYGDAVVDKGGLRVTTTLDLDLQDYAQNAVTTEVGKLKKQKVGNGAALVTRPRTGEILAMVGSKDYNATDEDGKVNIIFAKRQPGSSIKPLNYALALKDKKITPSTAFADVPTCFSVIGQELYCPVNYDGAFHGAVQTRFALANSYNVPAVRVLALNGLENFVDFAQSMGLTTLTDAKNYGLSLTLGGGEVKPLDMAVAFGVFANLGIKQQLVSILKVEDWKGKVLEETRPKEGDRVLTPAVSFLISHMLNDNGARSAAFGDHSYLVVLGHPEVSVKTGTTNDRRDNWTIGYSGSILALSWVGNNDNSPMAGAVSGVSGASPIWNRIISLALDKAQKGFYGTDESGPAWPKQPEDVVGATVCATTGAVPSGDFEGCPTRYEYFLEGTIPQTVKGGRQDVQIDKTTQSLAGSDTPPENIETQNKLMYYDPLDTAVCLDCGKLASQSVTIRYPITANH